VTFGAGTTGLKFLPDLTHNATARALTDQLPRSLYLEAWDFNFGAVMNVGHLVQLGSLSLVLVSLTACDPMSAPTAGTGGTQQVNAAPPPPPVCTNCGTIAQIEEVKEKGSASGIGAVVGAVAGAAIGHQVGDGRGNDAATAAGAIGGGITGHQVERRMNSDVYYNVTVNMENGGTHVAKVQALNGLSVGSKVKVVGNDLQLAG
jgi:outer membrane lipoprotein SlyB